MDTFPGSSVVKFTFSRRRGVVQANGHGLQFSLRWVALEGSYGTAPLPWPMEGESRQRIFVYGRQRPHWQPHRPYLLENGYPAFVGRFATSTTPPKPITLRAHATELGLEHRLELVEGDVLEADGWSEMLEGCDGLFHTATMYSTRATATTILDTANKGTTHLLHAAAETGIQRVITSSTAAVGTSPKGTTKDESVWNTDTSLPYTTAKTQSERLAWNLAEELGLDLRVINPTAVLGGGFVRPTPSVDFFGDAIAGYPVVPKFPMSVVHVRDVAKAHRRAFEVDEAEGRFILAPHANITLATICKRIRTLNPTTKAPNTAFPMSSCRWRCSKTGWVESLAVSAT